MSRCVESMTNIQHSPLSETKLSYKRVLELAQAMEAAEHDMQELQCNYTQTSSGTSCSDVGVGITHLTADSKLHATSAESVVMLLLFVRKPNIRINQQLQHHFVNQLSNQHELSLLSHLANLVNQHIHQGLLHQQLHCHLANRLIKLGTTAPSLLETNDS